MAYGTCFGTARCEDLERCSNIRYHPGLFVMTEVGMSLLSSATVLRLVDSMAILLSQACQLARARLASGASPRQTEATHGISLSADEALVEYVEVRRLHRRGCHAPGRAMDVSLSANMAVFWNETIARPGVSFL